MASTLTKDHTVESKRRTQYATAIVDADGLEAVTMRRLAQELGVATMTIYTYVPGKAELFDLMLDAAYAGMPRRDTSGWSWRRRLTAIAEENRELFKSHRGRQRSPQAGHHSAPG
jgi:AcrR family transcriptional regulator